MPQLLPSVGRWSVLVAVAAIVAACSESSTTPSRDLSPSAPNANQYPELNGPSADAHIMHTKPWFAANGNGNAFGHGGGGFGGNGISYHGGPVLLTSTNVVAVYWSSSAVFKNGPASGSGSASGDNSLVGFFLSHLGGSSYFNINSTYTDGTNHIANVVNYLGYWATGTDAPSSPSDADMVALLQSGFNSSKIAYNRNTLYLIMTPSGVNLGGGFGTQYCAYHTHGTVSQGTVLYAAMPYNQQFPGVCTDGTAAPNGDAGADAEVNTLGHEIEETTTDQMGNAWFDVRGYENADKCAWNFGTTQNNGTGVWNITVGGKPFLVQQNWVNANGGGCKQGW
jgi:hypothetical protein